MQKKFPQQFGPYSLLEKIGQGGMAEIFRAQTSGPNNFTKEVAIKRILSHLSANEDFVTQFLDEARIAGSLGHPNIVQIYDVAQVDNDYYIAMEFVDGRHLGQVIRRVAEKSSFFPIPVAACVINDVAKALAFAHSARDSTGQPLQIIHRDVSPQNILISYHGAVKLTDFGIAKAANKLYQTTAGVIKGKFSYLAPEQLTGAPASPGSDIFALGITFWEMLCNRRLFQGKTDIETIQLVQGCHVPPLAEFRSDADPEIEQILQKMVHRDNNQRYSQAHDLVHDLSHYLASKSVSEDMTVIGNFMGSLFQESIKTGGQPATEIGLQAMQDPRQVPKVETTDEPTRMINSASLSDFNSDEDNTIANEDGHGAPPTVNLPDNPLADLGDEETSHLPHQDAVDESVLQSTSATPPSIASARTSFEVEAIKPTKKRSRLPMVIMVFLLLLGGGGGGVLFWYQQQNTEDPGPAPPLREDPAVLRLKIRPSNARMTLNGTSIKTTGKVRVVKLVSGLTYHLHVSLSGYTAEKRKLLAREGETELHITLKKLASAKAPPKD